MSQHNDELNLSTIEQLLRIRKIDPTSNDTLTEQSVRQLGINIARDLMEYRTTSYKSVFDSLPDYNLVAGTSQWPKFVGMLLGAQFNSYRLFTSDYATFLPTPLGTLIQSGGTWYKTTHVDLEVDAHVIDSGLDLTIDGAAGPQIIAALMTVGLTEQQATEWHLNHVGFDPVNLDVEQRTARAVMFNRRLAELFYQWAPIEEVLHGVFATLDIGASILLSAHTVTESIKRFSIGQPLRTALQFIEPKYVHGGEPVTFAVILNFSDNTSRTEECYVLDTEFIESRNGNAVVFKEPASIRTIPIVVSYQGTEHPMQVTMFPLGIEPDPKEIFIEAPTLFGNSTSRIRVYGKYEDGTTRELTESGAVFITPDMGAMAGSSLVLPSAVEDTEISIRALYQGIADISITQYFKVFRSVREIVPVQMRIVVQDEIVQGVDTPILCHVTYNDTTTKIVVPQLTATSPDVVIVEDVLKSQVKRTNYMTSLSASFMDGLTVSDTVQVMLTAPVSVLAAVDIIIPDIIEERQVIRPIAKALYVTEGATQEQIDNRDPSIVVAYTEIKGQWFSSSDIPNNIYNLPDININDGTFIAPVVSDDPIKYSIHVTVLDNTTTKTFSRLFDVFDTQYVPILIDALVASKISNAGALPIKTAAKWNTGLTYGAAALVTVEYIPSQSAVTEAKERLLQLQKEAIAAGQDPTQYDLENIDYSRWITLVLTDLNQNIYDAMLQRQTPVKQLYFAGDLHGAARLHMTYNFEETTITNTRDVQLVPKRALVDHVQIECPDTINDQSRTFVRLFATYQDGTQEYVQAADWYGNWPEKDSDEYQVLRFFPAKYTGIAIIETIEGRAPVDIRDFRNMKVSKLPIFTSIGTIEQLRTTYWDGAIMQVGKCSEQTQSSVVARFYRIETKHDLLIVPTPRDSINKILNSRIDGATTFSAGSATESYALVNTYELSGITQILDGSYVQGEKSQFDMEVTATWSIQDHYLTEIDPSGDQILIPTQDPIAAIDDDGYVTPILNVNGAIRIRAQFLCDGAAIERFLLVYMTQANEYLRSITVIGQEVVWDIFERNSTAKYENGRWFIPYSIRVLLSDSTELLPTDAIWEIGAETNVEAVSIDSLTGALYIAEPQLSDAKIRINVRYLTTNPVNVQEEVITGTRVITFNSTRTIIEAVPDVPPSNIEPNKEYQAIMEYTRRSGSTASNINPDSDSVNFAWYVQDSVPGFTISPSGVFQFIPQKTQQEVQVGCVLTEQRTSIDKTMLIVCPGIGFPQDISIVGFTNVRDDSTMQMKAMLGRSATFNKEDVTEKALWTVTNVQGDTVTVQGISIDQKGILRIDQLLSDTNFCVRVTYIEQDVRLTILHPMTAYSSYPRYGSAPYGVNTITTAEQVLVQRLRSSVGGTFVLSPRTEDYGYFMCRASYGDALFAPGSDGQGVVNPDWNGFNGARWPITGDNGLTGPLVVRKSYDNVSENMHIYRSDARAFGVAVITVRYQ
ncbi:tail protein [Yersinia phage fHe-Yen9-02]|nr:tail protein [Yersinia phage fHe-Yen9-02]